MKVCVFGVGAVGGYLTARLGSAPGVELSAIARGPQLQAIRQNGIRVEAAGGESWHATPHATDDPASLPEQDIVFVTLKSMAQAGAAKALRRLAGDKGHVVFANNGMPWWWNHGTDTPGPLPLLDAGGTLWNEFGPEHAVGCVIYSANEVVAPGLVRHAGNNRWVIGEPDNSASERVQRTVDMMKSVGIGAEATTKIRFEVFSKLMRNAGYNTVAALTGLPVEWFSANESVKALIYTVIDEMAAIAAALGLDMTESREAARKLKPLPEGLTFEQGPKPSRLQDVIARRPMEVEALLGQVCAFADDKGVPCPSAKALLALLRGLDMRLKMPA